MALAATAAAALICWVYYSRCAPQPAKPLRLSKEEKRAIKYARVKQVGKRRGKAAHPY